MYNAKGTMLADIKLLVMNSGSMSQTAKKMEDISEQMDWTFWERCTQFTFLNRKMPKANPVTLKTSEMRIEISDQNEVLDFDPSHAQRAYTTIGEWKSPRIPLLVVAKDDVLFSAGNRGDESMYNRYFPHFLKSSFGEETISWSFEFLSSNYYPSEWKPYRWKPTIRFSDKNCVINPSLDDPRDQEVSYRYESTVLGLPECKNLILSWDDWESKDGWMKPPDVTCTLYWVNKDEEHVTIDRIECKQLDR
jgi:hypothetical protein